MARPVVLAVHPHWRLLHGGAGVQRVVHSGAAAPRARRRRRVSRGAAHPAAARASKCSRSAASSSRSSRSSSASRSASPCRSCSTRSRWAASCSPTAWACSFAFNVDLMRGTGTPALGQLYALLVMLTFLAPRRPSRADRRCWWMASARCPSAPRASRTRRYWTIVALGHPDFLGRARRSAARHHGAAHRQPRVRRDEPRGAVAQPVRGRLPDHARVRPRDHPGRPAFAAVARSSDLLGKAFLLLRTFGQGRLTPWPRSTPRRTEQPTQKRLDEARKNGQIPRSHGAERAPRC